MSFFEFNCRYYLKAEILKKGQSGLTLIELLIGLSLLSILFVISLSFYSTLYKKSEVYIIADEIKGAIQFSKLRAIIDGENLALTPISGSNNWSEGMVLFIDNKEHKLLENSKIIHEWHWQKAKVHVSWKGFQSSNYLLFSHELSRMDVNGNFIIRNSVGKEIKLIINRIGRVRGSNSS